MTYNSSIPLNTDYMVNSQIQIKSNFQSISNVFSKNHVALNTAQQGMHNTLTFRPQTVDPTTSPTQVSLYTKTVGSSVELFFAPSSSQTPIQLSYPSISTGLASMDPDVFLTQQYTFIAGPFVVYTGNLQVADGFSQTLTPTTTLIYVGLVIVDSGQGADKTAACATNVSGSSFTVRYSAISGTFKPLIRYTAIGI